MKNKKSIERARAVEDGIQMVWDSLVTHLGEYKGRDAKFHKECVRGYAKAILWFSQLY